MLSPMPDPAAIRELTHGARRRLADLLDGLGADEWATPSACEGWSVRDVVAHLVAWDRALLIHEPQFWPVNLARFVVAFAAEDRFNHRAIAKAPATGAELATVFRTQLQQSSHWLWDRVAPGAQLAEYVVHTEDIARPLGRTVEHDEATLRAALAAVKRIPGIGAKRRLVQHRWIATDIDWAGGVATGTGPPRKGPAIDVLLGLTGRGPLAHTGL